MARHFDRVLWILGGWFRFLACGLCRNRKRDGSQRRQKK
jgi:hypothetical protein